LANKHILTTLEHVSGCQVVSNQRGYPGEGDAEISFRSDWMIEL
jgi:hypothetical protein